MRNHFFEGAEALAKFKEGCGTRMSPASGIQASCRFEHDLKALSATPPNCKSGGRLNWEMLALWIFAVFSFAALIFAGYVIWAKCDGTPPF